MKKFVFPLQSVLKVRGLRKRLAERDVAETRARLDQNKRQLEGVREAYRASFVVDTDGTNPAFMTEVTNRYRQGLQNREQQLLEREQELTDTLEGQMRALTKRLEDEMVIAKLEERQRQEHLRRADAEEQAEIEEIDLLKRGLRS